MWIGGEAVEGYPRLLTVPEYLALGEVEPGYTELFEGRVLLTPTPDIRHARALMQLWSQLDDQLSGEFEAISNLDIDLELVPPHAPGFSRRPDLVVIRREVRHRLREDEDVLRASEVVVAVEIASATSQRTDRVAKRAEYADAGIPHYWIVDLDEPISLLACHLAGEFGYMDGGAVTGTFRTGEPFPFEIDLEALLD